MRTFAQKPPQATSDKSATLHRAHLGQRSVVSPIHNLQRTIENHAALRMLDASATNAKEDTASADSAGFGFDFSRVPVRAVEITPNLIINAPGDIHEQEADRVAGQVMRMPELWRPFAGEHPKRTGGQKSHELFQLMHMQPHEAGTAAPPIVHEVLRSPGQPLDTAARAFMEPRFGHDFSQVRIHTNAQAAESAAAVNAVAYTVGHDVVFSRGKFAPGSTEGKKLLAHELAHVSQNSRSTVRRQVTAPTSAMAVFGTIENKTGLPFKVEGSETQSGYKYPAILEPGTGRWGGDRPLPTGNFHLQDIDFIYPREDAPINGEQHIKFKIGFNDATLSPDPNAKDKNNSILSNFARRAKDNNE